VRLANWRTLFTAIPRKKFGVNDWNVTEESIPVVGLADFPLGMLQAGWRLLLDEYSLRFLALLTERWH